MKIKLIIKEAKIKDAKEAKWKDHLASLIQKRKETKAKKRGVSVVSKKDVQVTPAKEQKQDTSIKQREATFRQEAIKKLRIKDDKKLLVQLTRETYHDLKNVLKNMHTKKDETYKKKLELFLVRLIGTISGFVDGFIDVDSISDLQEKHMQILRLFDKEEAYRLGFHNFLPASFHKFYNTLLRIINENHF